MKVLYITDAYPTKKKVYSGVFEYYVEKELSKKVDIKVVRIKHRFRYSFLPVLIKTLLLSIYYKPEITLAITANTSGLIAALTKLLLREKIIVYARGSDISIFPNKNSISKLIIKFILNQADALVVISNLLGGEAVKYGMNKKIIHLIRTGVDFDLFRIKVDKRELRKKLGLPNENLIIFVGSLVPVKGIRDIMKPFSEIRDYKLLVIGSGYLEKDLKRLCDELNINDRVIFLGQKEHKYIPLYLKASNISIIPSRSEGLGTIILEAMAAGLPIISTKAGAIPEILTGKNAILVEPGNEEQILEALKKLIKDKNLQKEFSRNNIRDVKKYNRKLAPDKFLEVINKYSKQNHQI